MPDNISAGDLNSIKGSAKIIDVRSDEKFNYKHIPGAIHIQYDKLLASPEKYLNKNEKYYIYCQKGVKSLKMVQIFNRLGYNTGHVIGGYESWILKTG